MDEDCALIENPVEILFANTLLMMKNSSPSKAGVSRSFLEEFLVAAEEIDRSASDADSLSSDPISRKRPILEHSDSCDSSESQPTNSKKLCRGRYRCGRCGQPKTNHICALVNQYACLGSTATQVEIGCSLLEGARVLTARPRSISKL